MRRATAWVLVIATLVAFAAACGGPARRRRRLVAHEYQQCRAHIEWLTQRGYCAEAGSCTPDKVCQGAGD